MLIEFYYIDPLTENWFIYEGALYEVKKSVCLKFSALLCISSGGFRLVHIYMAYKTKNSFVDNPVNSVNL